MKAANEAEEETVRVPRQERGRQRVATLLQAAADVFVEKGYEAATMTEIAARAKASIGSLYQFFPTKELLASTLRTRYGTALIDGLLELSEAEIRTPQELANRFIQQFLDFMIQHPALMVIVEAQPIPVEHRNSMRQRQRDHITQILLSHAPHLTPERVPVVATMVQQLLRTAVWMQQETPTKHQEAALTDLRTMLGTYLQSEFATTAAL